MAASSHSFQHAWTDFHENQWDRGEDWAENGAMLVMENGVLETDLYLNHEDFVNSRRAQSGTGGSPDFEQTQQGAGVGGNALEQPHQEAQTFLEGFDQTPAPKPPLAPAAVDGTVPQLDTNDNRDNNQIFVTLPSLRTEKSNHVDFELLFSCHDTTLSDPFEHYALKDASAPGCTIYAFPPHTAEMAAIEGPYSSPAIFTVSPHNTLRRQSQGLSYLRQSAAHDQSLSSASDPLPIPAPQNHDSQGVSDEEEGEFDAYAYLQFQNPTMPDHSFTYLINTVSVVVGRDEQMTTSMLKTEARSPNVNLSSSPTPHNASSASAVNGEEAGIQSDQDHSNVEDDSTVPPQSSAPTASEAFLPILTNKLDDIKGVSKYHLRVFVQNLKWYVQVLGRNGLYIDNDFQPQHTIAPLRDGCKFTLSKTDVLFRNSEGRLEDKDDSAGQSDSPWSTSPSDSSLSHPIPDMHPSRTLGSEEKDIDEEVDDDDEEEEEEEDDEDGAQQQLTRGTRMKTRGRPRRAPPLPPKKIPKSSLKRAATSKPPAPKKREKKQEAKASTPKDKKPPVSVEACKEMLLPGEEVKKKKGPGRPPGNGVMSKREFNERKKAQIEREKLLNGNASSSAIKKSESLEGSRETTGSAEPADSNPKKKRKRGGTVGEDAVKGNGDPSSSRKQRKQKKDDSPASPEPPKYTRANFSEEELQPPKQLTYALMLYKVLRDNDNEPMGLKELYEGIMTKWPHYRFRGDQDNKQQGWQSSVRHTIQQQYFEQVEKSGKSKKIRIRDGAPEPPPKSKSVHAGPTTHIGPAAHANTQTSRTLPYQPGSMAAYSSLSSGVSGSPPYFSGQRPSFPRPPNATGLSSAQTPQSVNQTQNGALLGPIGRLASTSYGMSPVSGQPASSTQPSSNVSGQFSRSSATPSQTIHSQTHRPTQVQAGSPSTMPNHVTPQPLANRSLVPDSQNNKISSTPVNSGRSSSTSNAPISSAAAPPPGNPSGAAAIRPNQPLSISTLAHRPQHAPPSSSPQNATNPTHAPNSGPRNIPPLNLSVAPNSVDPHTALAQRQLPSFLNHFREAMVRNEKPDTQQVLKVDRMLRWLLTNGPRMPTEAEEPDAEARMTIRMLIGMMDDPGRRNGAVGTGT